MVQTITLSSFCDAFHAHDRYDQFGYQALRVIYDYMEEVAPDAELDVIALCCDFNVQDVEGIAQDYNIDLSDADGDEDEQEAIVLKYLHDNTSVLGQCRDGIVYQCF